MPFVLERLLNGFHPFAVVGAGRAERMRDFFSDFIMSDHFIGSDDFIMSDDLAGSVMLVAVKNTVAMHT